MTSLGVAVIVQASMLATGSDSYAAAYRVSSKTGQPLVVMVGASWCGPCRQMKQNVLPQVRQRGGLSKVTFATVGLDRQQQLGHQLTGGGPIPQLLMYRKTSTGWKRRKLIGSHGIGTVEAFISQGIRLDEATRRGLAAPEVRQFQDGETVPQRAADKGQADKKPRTVQNVRAAAARVSG